MSLIEDETEWKVNVSIYSSIKRFIGPDNSPLAEEGGDSTHDDLFHHHILLRLLQNHDNYCVRIGVEH